MTINELIAELEDIAETTDGEREVRVAQQPSWPLAALVSNVWDPCTDLDDPDSDVADGVVWIATHESGNYAPLAAWQSC